MRLWKRLYEGKESFLQNKDIATQKPFQSRFNCSLSFRPVELAPMKKRSLPASVCSECSFLLKELTKLQENQKFFNEGLSGLWRPIQMLQRTPSQGFKPRISLTTGKTIPLCVIIGERAGETLKADHKL
jgi:hypothetical protein